MYVYWGGWEKAISVMMLWMVWRGGGVEWGGVGRGSKPMALVSEPGKQWVFMICWPHMASEGALTRQKCADKNVAHFFGPGTPIFCLFPSDPSRKVSMSAFQNGLPQEQLQMTLKSAAWPPTTPPPPHQLCKFYWVTDSFIKKCPTE